MNFHKIVLLPFGTPKSEPADDGFSKIKLQPKIHYIPGFDILRGLAVLFVLLLHGSYGFFKGGWVGVDLFFVLSGYLITSLLLNEYLATGKISISKFYSRRALRLFPPLILCIIIANILWSFTQLYPGADREQATFAALFYFTNLIPGNILGNMEHLWSLSVEEHFYIFWPILASLFFFKISFRNCLALLMLLILLASVFRIYAYNFNVQLANGLITVNPSRFSLCRMDCILLGVVLAITLSQSKYRAVSITGKTTTILLASLFTLFVIILFTVADSNAYWLNGGFVFTNLICASTVFVAIKSPHHFLLSNKIFRWLGIRSYGIYVYHFPVFLAFERLRLHHSIVNFLLVTLLRFAVTLIIAELSFRYVETPILRYKKRYEVSGKF